MYGSSLITEADRPSDSIDSFLFKALGLYLLMMGLALILAAALSDIY
jgi:hypothetical protein